jgi:hypothetical protein
MALSCVLHLKGYGTYRVGATFGVSHRFLTLSFAKVAAPTECMATVVPMHLSSNDPKRDIWQAIQFFDAHQARPRS